MDLIAIAEQKRDWHRSEAARYDAFLVTAKELGAQAAKPITSPAAPTPAAEQVTKPAPRRAPPSRPMTGIGADTLNAAEMVVGQEGPMSSRDLLPHVTGMGIEVGGKDPVATLSARISGKGDLVTYNGKWHFKKDLAALGLAGLGQKETADNPAKDPSAVSLFTQTMEDNDAAPLA